MPGLISVNEFVEETREDYNSPTTSTFVSRMPDCRQTVANLEEVRFIFNSLPFYFEDIASKYVEHLDSEKGQVVGQMVAAL